jgi:hypothetical protein
MVLLDWPLVVRAGDWDASALNQPFFEAMRH